MIISIGTFDTAFTAIVGVVIDIEACGIVANSASDHRSRTIRLTSAIGANHVFAAAIAAFAAICAVGFDIDAAAATTRFRTRLSIAETGVVKVLIFADIVCGIGIGR